MRKNQLIGLAVVTLLFVAVAGYVLYERQAEVITEVTPGERLFPDLESRVNQVAQVEIRNSDGTFTAVRNADDVWVIKEKHDYPAKVGKIRELILGITNARILEKRTSNPDLYGRLQVEPIDGPDAKSGQVVLRNADGEQLAGLVIGKRRLRGRFGAGTDQLYVRKIDGAQSWLADDIPSVLGGLNQWLERDLVNVARKRVQRVTNTRPEGDQLVVRRESPDTDNVTVEDLPQGAKPDQFRANDVASALEWVILDDVLPVSELDGTSTVGFSRYETFDGLLIDITVRSRKPEGAAADAEPERWVVLDAGFNPEGVAEEAKGLTPAPAEPAESAAAEASGPQNAEDGQILKAPETVRIDATELAERFRGWAYKLPDWKVEVFLRRQADLVDKENSGS